MKTLATIGDNCVDIYPQLNKAFSGGNAVNVAVYCTRYGIQPGCITWVGDDDYGTKLKQDLARMGVDISHVHTKHGVTAQTQVELHDNDRVFGDYTEGVMADFALSEEDYAWLAQYDIVHAAIWGHAEDAFPQLHAAGKLTAFDFSDKWDSPLWQTLVPHLDFAFASAPQEDETLRLKMKAIVARGAGTVIVTLGENGSIAWDGAQFWRQAPEPVTVIDTMGAGDSFIAGFLCGWSAGMTLPQAMAQGTACAAKTIQYHGAWYNVGVSIFTPTCCYLPENDPIIRVIHSLFQGRLCQLRTATLINSSTLPSASDCWMISRRGFTRPGNRSLPKTSYVRNITSAALPFAKPSAT